MIKLTNGTTLLVGVCYRASGSVEEYNRKLNEMLLQVQRVNSGNVLVMGDFNYPQIDWEIGRVEGPEMSSQVQFYDTIQDLFWVQHVNFPTRFRESCTSSLLDLVFSNDELAVGEISGSDPLGKSDHIVITWKYNYEDSMTKTSILNREILKRNFKKANYTKISEDIGRMDWSSLVTMNVDDAWDKIKSLLNTCMENHVPLVKPKKCLHPRAPWWSEKLLKDVKLKHAAWKKYRLSGSTDDNQKYIQQRNKTTQVIKDARYAYEENIIQNVKQEPKRLFKYVRSQQKIKPGIGPLEKDTGEQSQDNQEAAEILNEYFQSVFINEGPEELPVFANQVEPDCAIHNIEITPANVHKELMALDINKAAGPDDIPAILLRNCADQLAVPLSYLFQRSLETGRLPRDSPQGHRPVRSVDGSSAPSAPANPSRPSSLRHPNTHYPFVPPIPYPPPQPVLPRLLSEPTPTPGMKGSWRLSPPSRGSVVAAGQHASLAWISGREGVLSEAPH